MRNYVVRIPEIARRQLTVKYDRFNRELMMYCDGILLKKNDDNKYFIEDDDGNMLVFRWDCDMNDNPVITSNDIPVIIETKLKWYEWAVAGLPIILLFLGGFIGGAIGGLAVFLNIRVMRSSCSAPARYSVCLATSLGACIVFVLIVAGLHLAFGFGKGGALNKYFTDTIEQITPSELEASRKSGNMPNVYADNPTDSSLQFSIDGGKPADLAPFTYATFKVTPGKRKFTFSSKGKEVDVISEELPENKVALLSPKGVGEYVILTGSYSTNVFSIGGTMETPVNGKKFILADFGILEALPEKIEIKLKSSEYGKTFSRTQIVKSLPKNPGSQEAFVILSKYFEKQENPFLIHETERALIFLLNALAAEPRKPEHMNILLEYAAKSQKYILEAALKSLASYSEQIPDDTLAKFAAENESVASGGMSFNSPAIDGRSGWAIRALIRRNKLNLVTDNFSKLPLRNQQLVLKCAADSEKDEAISLAILKALDSANPADTDSVRSVWRMIMSPGFRPDDSMMQKTDKFISSVSNDETRRRFSADWEEKLKGIAGENPDSEYLRNRILESLKGAKVIDSKNIRPIIKLGLYKELAGIFPSMEGQAKMHLIGALPKKETDKVPEGALRIAWLALDDPGESVSASAMGYLARNNPSDMEFLRKMWVKLNAIQDEKERKKFQQLIWSNSYAKVSVLTLQEACSVAAESPTRDFVKQVFDRLEHRSDDRIPNFSELLKIYPSVASERNRRWIMEELGEVTYLQFASRKPEELELFKKLFSLGFDDQAAKVRAAALNSSFRLERADFPDENTAEKIISSDIGEGDGDIIKNYEFWICRTWDNFKRDRNYRSKALAKIVGVVNSTKYEEVAKFASSRLDHPTPEEKDYIASLAKIAAENKFRECRIEAMTHLSALDFSKDDNVTKVFLKNLSDNDAEIRWRAFMALAHKCQKYNLPFRTKNLPALKKAAARESDQKTKADMERFLKDHLDAFEKPQTKAK